MGVEAGGGPAKGEIFNLILLALRINEVVLQTTPWGGESKIAARFLKFECEGDAHRDPKYLFDSDELR